MKSNPKWNLIRFSRLPFTAAGRTNKDTSFKWMGMPGTHSFPLAFCLLLAWIHPWVKNLSKVAWVRHQGSKNEITMGWKNNKLHWIWIRSSLLNIFYWTNQKQWVWNISGFNYWIESMETERRVLTIAPQPFYSVYR